jgi:hypothetical protein
MLSSFAVALDDPPLPQAKRQPVRPIGGITTPVADTTVSDEEALKAAGLTAEDGPKLVEYLIQRTLSDADQGKIAGIIKRFGADDFDDRVKATEEIELYGPAAVGPLKTAERDSDPEIAYRARIVLKKMAKIPHSAVAAATVRAIVKLKPEGATAALIGFLPLADDETIADSIRDALTGLAVKDGKADPSLIRALSDNSAMRRSAAYIALTIGGPPGERIRIKDAYPKVREAILKESDPEAKFIGLWSLLLTTREKEFMPELIGMIPQIGRGRIWQLEDLLLQVAGSHPKDGRFLKSPESLTKTRDAWLGWWKAKGDKVDFVKFEFNPRVLGVTDVIEMDIRYGQGRIVSLGPDMKEKWHINGLNSPTDLLVLSNDRVIIVELNMSRIIERSPNGTAQINRFIQQQPLNIQKTPEGGMLVVCRNRIIELDKDWKEILSYTRQPFDIVAGVRLPKGDVLFVTNAFQGANCIKLDNKLKETAKTYTFGRIQSNQIIMDAIDDDKLLVCEFDRVAEYDLKTGKQTWKHECNNPCSCQRLINGNTLITLVNTNQVIEVDPSGEIVWEYQAKEGLKVSRARRR